MITAIVGINWGDEGKGRIVDLLADQYDIVARYQGGNNAGHTVINHLGKFVLNLLPSAILNENAVNVMGGGMVIDVEHLSKEIEQLRKEGIKISPENLKISNKATVCLPYHVLMDCIEEDRLGDKKFGSTRRGIAPVYADKFMKKTIRMGDLLDLASVEERIADMVEWKNLTVVGGYNEKPIDTKAVMDWLKEFGVPFADYICDTTKYLGDAAKADKKIMFEAQLGALRDIDFGIYPYTSSSSTIAAYAPIGAGIPSQKIDKVLGIIKAYSSCVGEGAFTCELFDNDADLLREAGGEYGAATGRPRRVGGFDVVASKYGVMVQGATSLALTKMDILSCYEKIPVCVAYEVDGVRTTDFPTDSSLDRATPVYEYLEGFGMDVAGITEYDALPQAAKDYIKFVEDAVGCKVEYVSTGAERNSYIKMF